MKKIIFFLQVLILSYPITVVAECDKPCQGMGCAHYCDSSGGRTVCTNGDYSVFYCDRHAVMNMQKFEGCCMWHGGVRMITPVGAVVCNDLTVSELCTKQHPIKKIAAW